MTKERQPSKLLKVVKYASLLVFLYQLSLFSHIKVQSNNGRRNHDRRKRRNGNGENGIRNKVENDFFALISSLNHFSIEHEPHAIKVRGGDTAFEGRKTLPDFLVTYSPPGGKELEVYVEVGGKLDRPRKRRQKAVMKAAGLARSYVQVSSKTIEKWSKLSPEKLEQELLKVLFRIRVRK